LAVSHGSTAIIDMTATTFCDWAGARAIVPAHKRATGSGAELRLVIAAGPVRISGLLGIDRLLDTYPNVEAARARPDMNTGNGIRVSPQPLLASPCSGH
jgi:anti-anti-sigma regulatory factor